MWAWEPSVLSLTARALTHQIGLFALLLADLLDNELSLHPVFLGGCSLSLLLLLQDPAIFHFLFDFEAEASRNVPLNTLVAIVRA